MWIIHSTPPASLRKKCVVGVEKVVGFFDLYCRLNLSQKSIWLLVFCPRAIHTMGFTAVAQLPVISEDGDW